MSTALANRRAAGAAGRPARTARRADRGDPHGAWPSLFETAGGEPTLDEVLGGVWEGLTAQEVVVCPVCAGSMKPQYGPHALPIGGRCQSCDSALT